MLPGVLTTRSVTARHPPVTVRHGATRYDKVRQGTTRCDKVRQCRLGSPFFHGRIFGRIVRFRSESAGIAGIAQAYDLWFYVYVGISGTNGFMERKFSSSINRSAVLWAALLPSGRGLRCSLHACLGSLTRAEWGARQSMIFRPVFEISPYTCRQFLATRTLKCVDG